MQVDPQRDASGGRGLEAWRSLLR
ncbi:MAG: hypothetical protein QOD13_2763, partial [Thermoleophilaceae bacterium]|nr:hypothetical protein [Thermoleophilaceae bacterium]